MAVPKKRKSSSRTRMGRSHQALSKNKSWIENDQGEIGYPHMMIKGWYKGRQVIIPKQKKTIEAE